MIYKTPIIYGINNVSQDGITIIYYLTYHKTKITAFLLNVLLFCTASGAEPGVWI
jgi:hypothetical protein